MLEKYNCDFMLDVKLEKEYFIRNQNITKGNAYFERVLKSIKIKLN